MTPRIVLFTDLDGTLLDRETYACDRARPALDRVRGTRTPLVFCSAKTRAEQEHLRAELGIPDPFIVEDGGAVFIPERYFAFEYAHDRRIGDFLVIELGRPYGQIREALDQIRRETGLPLAGFGDLSVEEVAAATGLNPDSAVRARQREYEETVVTPLDDDQARRVRDGLAVRGFRLRHGGRFLGVTGENDKGRAVEALIELYRRQSGDLRTVGIGDSANDASLLAAVDERFLVQKPGGVWEDLSTPGLQRVDAVGPDGWNRVVLGLLPPVTRG